MSTKKSNKEGKIVRYMKAPVKIMGRVHDFYVNSLNGCSGQVAYYGGSTVGCPTPYNPAGLPRSFSANSSSSYNPNQSSRDEDMRELVRVAEAELLRQGKSPAAAAVSRSRTVVIGRIDEDKPCEFDAGEMKPLHDFPKRSKSYAAASGRSRWV